MPKQGGFTLEHDKSEEGSEIGKAVLSSHMKLLDGHKGEPVHYSLKGTRVRVDEAALRLEKIEKMKELLKKH